LTFEYAVLAFVSLYRPDLKGLLKGGNTMKSREEYIDKLSSQLKEWSAKIDELESKARAAKAEAKTGYEHQIGQLKDKRDAATKKLQELRGSSSDAWDALKVGAETAWTDLKNAVTAAKEKFK
jgi:predicted  nucleic acid-binding Zn-ribbon protein